MNDAMEAKKSRLRTLITENLRIQKNTTGVDFVDSRSLISDLAAKQNHVVFARRGCGKTLLLTQSSTRTADDVNTIYLNCEDFKRHSFPNVLLEILQAVFSEMAKSVSGTYRDFWGFRRKRLARQILADLNRIKRMPDSRSTSVKRARSESSEKSRGGNASANSPLVDLGLSETNRAATTMSIEMAYDEHYEKLEELNRELPHYKEKIGEFFDCEQAAKALFVQIDDLYHLERVNQAFVVDYVHRLCKDLPLFFRFATLRHVSTLYVDNGGQPFGAQERHDYQPVN